MGEHTRKLLIGTACILSTAFVLACYNALSKFLQADRGVTAFQITFFSFSVSFVLSCFGKKPPLKELHKVPYLSLYFYRTLVGIAAFYLLILSTKYLPLLDATLLFNTAPIFVPYLALFLLGQQLNHKLWIPLLIGLGGLILILRPGEEVLNIAALIGVAAGFSSALVVVFAKKLSRVAEPSQILFYYFMIGTVLTAPPLIWTWTPVSLGTFMVLTATGALTFIFAFSFTRGIVYIPPTTASILLYFGIAFSALFDWWFWHHIPRFLTLVGVACVIVSGIVSILLERKYEIKK